KLYHAEVGTPVVDQIVNTPGNPIRISRLTVAERTSAFAIKVRTQSISREDADLFLRQFRRDIATGKLEVFSVAESNLLWPSRLLSATRSTCVFVRLTLFSLQWRWNCEIRSWSIILSTQMPYFARW